MAEERLDSVVRQALSLPPEQRPAFLAEQLGDDLEARALALVKLRELEEVTLPVDLQPGDAAALQRGNDGPNTTRVAACDEPVQPARHLRLSPAELTRLQDLFERACELDPEQRPAFITANCGDQPQLAEELQALLDSDISLRDFTVRPIDPIKALARPQSPFYDRPGAQLGRYSLVRQLGKGGMGTVWLAQRADGQFQRTVALKLISAGQESEAIQARFLRERQILASLSHPNIAKLLDGGVASDGRPYFVMEYVDGEPITGYCDERHFTVVERLRLFLQVCRAVQHAHQRLVVHRDLKPSNILVTAERMVQLLDFGIAKLLHPDLMGLSDLTRPEDQAMTPRYAAPEQIRNETITTATDIYAMGVLLYELLTGRMPYNIRSSAGHALEQAILDSEPRRPSLSLTDPAEADCESIAGLRGAQIPQLRQAIAGDLETVVLKALKKHPAERYPSVEAFAKDLEHYLDGRPISARPDTVSYRVGKFIARHRAGVALVSLSFLGLLLALIVSLTQTQRAEEAAQRAAAVDAFLVGLFETIDPELGDLGTLGARDLLDTGAARIDHELDADPALQGSLNAIVGRLFLATGDPQRALQRLQKAHDSESLPVETRRQLEIDFARALTANQRFEQAEAFLSERIDRTSADRAQQARLLSALADLQAETGRYVAAQESSRSALALWRQLPSEHQLERAESLAVLAKTADLADDLDSAESSALQALQVIEEHYGSRHLRAAQMLARLANVQRRKGDPEAAGASLDRAIAMSSELVGSDHLVTLGMRRVRADTLEEVGDLAGSEAMLQSVIEDAEKRYGDSHLSRAFALNSLAGIAFRQRDLVLAESRLREVLRIYRSNFGNGANAETATVMNNLANVLRERGKLRESLTLMEQVLNFRRAVTGEHSYDYAFSLLGMARLQLLGGEPEGALTNYQQAAEIFQTVLGADHPDTLNAQTRAIHVLIDLGRTEAARGRQQLIAKPVDSSTARGRKVQWMLTWADARLAVEAGEVDQAESLYSDVRRATEALSPRDSARMEVAFDYAQLLSRTGRTAEANQLLAAVPLQLVDRLPPRTQAIAESLTGTAP